MDGVGRPGPWIQIAECSCGWKKEAPFGILFHIHETVCPICGTPKYKNGGAHPDWSTPNWEVKTMRWVKTSVWWKPSTWGNGYWEEYSRDRHYA